MQSIIQFKSTFYKLLKTSGKLLSLGALLLVANANASRCVSNVVSSSIYFIPDIKDYCKTKTPCAKFRRAVRMQGSGTLPGNRLLTYTGKIVKQGSCKTAFGASGKCLTPFISVAADPRYYNMGDIIQMPAMKGKVMSLPDGTNFVHPGYFIVQDTGGAIKGPNRFDFFTGPYGILAKNNAFGAKGSSSTRLLDIRNCSNNKMFKVVRRGSSVYQRSLASIENALQKSSETRAVASSSSGTRSAQ